MLQKGKTNYWTDLGKIDYMEALDLQYKLVYERKENKIPDTVLFLEHYNVYTTGRKSVPDNYKNVNVIQTDRGGDVTYHGDGQLIAYFIFDVRINGKKEVKKFLEKIEKSYIDMLKSCGYKAMIYGEPGIWIDHGGIKTKVASLGMAIDDYVSYHGMALNISDAVLDGFRLINPCGMNSNVISYVNISREEARSKLLKEFSKNFGPFEEVNKEKLVRTRA
ncbi:lipoyl(octanoyl) transferase LipB [Ferroplasma sp.]|uniref:lipoyl(octanoyl) transferase LipB n=1 Tax=Ferroplasma sp. TaxID=2591003 RepID=UPI00307CFA36